MQCYGFDIACQIPIPFDCHSSLHARYLIKMWSLLDKAVELEWISPFLLLQATLALENNSWKMSHSIKRELIKRRIEALEELKELRKKHSNGCYNSNCLLKLEGDSSLIKCTKCLLAKYCKNYDFVPLPLPSRYRFRLPLPSVHHRYRTVTSPSLTVPHRSSPSLTVPLRQLNTN